MNRSTITVALALFCTTLSGQTPTKIFTSDIDNFWTAFDSVQTTKDTVKQTQFIQTLYLDKATEGLKDFMVARQHSAQRHLNNILKNPKFWISIRPLTLQIKSFKSDIDTLMLRFKRLYPNFKQPSVYFTIGCLNSGGTTSADKILIGSEIAASDSTVDASELGNWLKGVFKDNRNVVYLVAHEVGHTQQIFSDSGNIDGFNLLTYSIGEGACDLIAELLLEQPISTPYMTYGKANEKKIWQNFQKEMKGKEIKNWLYNAGAAPNGHADLGYFVGYSICKSYYEHSKDKKQAFKDIIELDLKEPNVLKFLKKSKYQDKWK